MPASHLQRRVVNQERNKVRTYSGIFIADTGLKKKFGFNLKTPLPLLTLLGFIWESPKEESDKKKK